MASRNRNCRRGASRPGRARPAQASRPATVACDVVRTDPAAIDPGRCPVCGSADIEDQGAHVSGAHAVVEGDCYACGSRFERIYTLAAAHISRRPAAAPIGRG